MEFDRYLRQITFKEIGTEGQRKLSQAFVVIIGMGALGSHTADMVVRAGVGKVRMVDDDVVQMDNLQRQVLFDEEDARLARPKVIAAARRLREINSEVQIEPVVERARPSNILNLIRGANVVLDCTDRLSARYLINDACARERIPWVYTGVVASYGMSATIVPGETPCLRCILGEPPDDSAVDTAATAGIIAPVVRMMSAIAVAEAMKLIIGTGRRNPWLLYVDLWHSVLEKLELPPRRPDCPVCQGKYEFLEGKEQA
jgi:adenylyltransferase/sulfurtransferase